MNKKEKAVFKKALTVLSMITDKLEEGNMERISHLLSKVEEELRKLPEKSSDSEKKDKPKAFPLWRDFSNMTEEEIRQELNNVEKYPDLRSIKSAVKGFLPMRKVSKVKTRETLISHIIEEYKRREHIGEIGR